MAILKTLSKLLRCLLLVIAATSVSVRAEPVGTDPLAGFDEFAERTIRDWQVPGIAVAIVKDGQVLLARGYGVRDVKTGKPFDKDTLFPIASTTKAFTSFGIAMLVDQGKLRWDAPVRPIIPGFDMVDPVAADGLSLRDMLSHRSGLPRHDAIHYHNDELTRSELVARIKYLQPSAPFRTRFQYNNLMYVAAGHVVELVTGQEWEAYTREHIFLPLEMSRTTFSAAAAEADGDHYSGYQISLAKRIEVPFVRSNSLNAPAGGIYSTAEDLSHWLAVQTFDGSYKGRQLVSASALGETHSPVMPIGATPETPEITPAVYGMGWFIDTYRGQRRVWHTGNLSGASTIVTLFPDKNLGIVVLANLHLTRLPEMMVRHIADRILGLAPVDWAGEDLKKTRAEQAGDKQAQSAKQMLRVAGTLPAHALAAYVGEYENPGYGRFKVTMDGKLLRAAYNDDSADLEHWHYEVFAAKTDDPSNLFSDVRIQFITDVNGHVAGLESALEPQVEPIRFKRLPNARLFDSAYLSKLTGVYDMDGTPVTITLVGNRLNYSPQGGRPADLVPSIDDSFVHPRAPALSFKFVTDATGRATALQQIDDSGVHTAKRK